MTSQHIEAIVIGASAGAVEALTIILSALPIGFALPMFVVVHVPPDRRSLLAELFAAKCQIPVREADDKEPIRGGTVYFAPADYHLLIEKQRSLALSSDEPVLFSRPSIDVLFESAADAYGPSLIAIVLTGANQDAAKGAKAVLQSGGTVIVQNPDEAFARAMPLAAIAMCPAAHVMSLAEITTFLEKV